MRMYASYGSNMNIEQMVTRCEDARMICRGFVKGYKLAFRKGTREGGVATMIKGRKDDMCPVLIWKISEADEKSLDKYEGFPWLYTKIMVDVWTVGGTMRVMTYVMTSRHNEPSVPSKQYYQKILQGYEDAGHEREYLIQAARGTMEEMIKYYNNVS